MKRTHFEDALIRNAHSAHDATRRAGVPAILGVPAYLTGWAIGSLIGATGNLLAGSRAR